MTLDALPLSAREKWPTCYALQRITSGPFLASAEELALLENERYKLSMQEIAKLLNRMVKEGVILDYAVFGAIAQMRYTEAVATFDAGILIAVTNPDAIDVLRPIYEFCTSLGYQPEREAIRVGAWPMQLIPAFDPLTEHAIQEAQSADLEGTSIRVVSATYLAVIALSVGRAKDFTRILALRENGAVEDEQIATLAENFGLTHEWNRFTERFDEK